MHVRARLAFAIALVCGGVALLAGCSQVPSTIYQSVELQSCVDGARAVQFDLVYTNSFVTNLGVTTTSPNVVGTPAIVTMGPSSFQVTAELNNVANGGTVSIGLDAEVAQYGLAQWSNVRFFTDPPQSLGLPACGPRESPRFETVLDPVLGLVLEVSNLAMVPVELLSMELVASPVLLAPHQLDWANSDFNALPWLSALPGVVLAPGGPPLVIDLPEMAPPGTAAVLHRFAWSYGSGESDRAITQIDMVGRPISVQSATWGEAKKLFR